MEMSDEVFGAILSSDSLFVASVISDFFRIQCPFDVFVIGKGITISTFP